MIEDFLQPLVEIPCYFLGRFSARFLFPNIHIVERDFNKHTVKLREERWSFSFTYSLNGKRYFKDDTLTLLGFLEVFLIVIIIFVLIY